MRLKQGGWRSKPDGFLHLNNFAHTQASGLAGVLYERVFTERQQEIVLKALLELAPEESIMFEHEVWRFKKEFLKENFKGIVYGTVKLLRKSAAQMMSMAIVSEEMEVSTIKVQFPKWES